MRISWCFWLAGTIFFRCAAESSFAQEPAPGDPQAGDVQIFRNPRETVIVISNVGPVEKQSGALAAGDLLAQMKQALDNLRRTAIRSGVLPSQIVTITVFTPETASGEVLRKMPRDSYRDWNPLIAVEARQLGTPGALVEIEAVAISRDAKPR
jgi:enamine deaminase RidA (YjgF/YER057c/UK114 family)